MHVNLARRLPLSMLLGLTIAGAGVAAPLGQPERLDDRLVLIAESELHGIAVSGSGSAKKLVRPHAAHANSLFVPKQISEPADSLAQLSAVAATTTSTAALDTDGVDGVDAVAKRALVGSNFANDLGTGRPGGALQAWTAVPAHLLDDLRGGFDTSLNLTLSFGIERAVYLNGALVTTTSFNLPALGSLPRDDTSGPLSSTGSVALLQNGPGNTFVQARDATPLAATVIQNTLNNQALQSLTTINASSNSLQILRTNAFQSMLQDGIGHVIVPH